MTSTEFDEWFKYHCAAFEGLAEWMDKKVEKDKDAFRLWGRAVRRISLRCAKQATEAMLADETMQEGGYTKHPAKINTYAKEHGGIEGTKRRQSYIDGVATYNCATCRDEGTISVFSPDAMDAMRIGQFSWKHAHEIVAVGCTCAMGYASCQNVKWQKGPLVQFDPKRMVLAACPNDKASVAALAAFFAVEVPAYSPPVHQRPKVKQSVVEAPSGDALKKLGALAAELASGKVIAPKPTVKAETSGAPSVLDYDESEATVGEHDEPWHPGLPDKF